jgi:hypothetical protein
LARAGKENAGPAVAEPAVASSPLGRRSAASIPPPGKRADGSGTCRDKANRRRLRRDLDRNTAGVGRYGDGDQQKQCLSDALHETPRNYGGPDTRRLAPANMRRDETKVKALYINAGRALDFGRRSRPA